MSMNHDEKAAILVEKMASNEESIAQLYEKYADAFPALNGFWDSLRAEELQHASWLRNLAQKTGKGQVFIDEKRFNTAAIQTFTDYLHQELSRISKQQIPIIEAISIAYYIEQSLIENKFFEIFKTDSAELRQTLSKLRDDTISHFNKVKQTLENYRTK
jgi:rubrerythrin